MIALLLAWLPAATLQGTVRTQDAREPIPYATVRIPELGRGVLTDAHGYFVLSGLPVGRWRVEASALGHRPHAVTIEMPEQGAVRLELALAQLPVKVAGVDVRVDRDPRTGPADAIPLPGPGIVRMDSAGIRRLPGIAQADVLCAVDPGAVASVDVHTGALPASVGDRLGSAVGIRTRTGGRDRVRGWGGVGLLTTHAGADGPLPGGRGGLLASGRHNHLSSIARLLGGSLGYASSDFYLKGSHELGSRGSVIASL